MLIMLSTVERVEEDNIIVTEGFVPQLYNTKGVNILKDKYTLKELTGKVKNSRNVYDISLVKLKEGR